MVKLFYNKTVKNILQTIDYHTLTIEILAKTAQNLEIKSLDKVVDLLEERGIKIGKPVDFSTIIHSKEEQTRYLFSYLEAIFQLPDVSKSERYLLKQFIGLPPIFFTWKEITSLLKISEEQEAIWDEQIMARNQLKKTGWLLYNEENEAYKMHRIIQDVLEKKLNPTSEDLETLVNSVCDLLEIEKAGDNPINKALFIGLGKRILQIIPHSKSKGFALLQSRLGTVYRILGEYEQAKSLLSRAMQWTVQNCGQDHIYTATSRSDLATIYYDLEHYEQAKDLLDLAIDTYIRNFDKDHPGTVRITGKLAFVYIALGNSDQAEILLRQNLHSTIRTFGEDHPETAIDSANLAVIYRDLGHYNQAKKLLQKAFSVLKSSSGKYSLSAQRVKRWLDSIE